MTNKCLQSISKVYIREYICGYRIYPFIKSKHVHKYNLKRLNVEDSPTWELGIYLMKKLWKNKTKN